MTPLAPRALALVALGGALGSTARYAAQLLMQSRYGVLFPWGTLSVNLAGAALMGLLAGLLNGRAPEAALFFGTGVLGGFTTYSAFNQEALLLLARGEVARGALYLAATVVGALAVGGAAFALGRALSPA